MILVILLSLLLVTVSAVDGGQHMQLWDGPAPAGGGMSETAPADAIITVHRPAQPNGVAIVICPGGGYGMRMSGPEGHVIATWLNVHGITGVVLDYRLPKGRAEVPLADAQRAIRLTRGNAAAWGVDPKRVGIMGFSAGGHLAASAATLAVPGITGSPDPLERLSSRPDFAILVYPVISMQDGLVHGGSRTNLLGANPTAEVTERFSPERHVSATTCPVYLAHAVDDTVVSIDNSRIFTAAMRAAKRPVELLELPSGGHGLNGYQGPSWDAWQSGCLRWLAEQPFQVGR